MKQLLLTLLCSIQVIAYGQVYNPLLTNAVMLVSPLGSVETNGSGAIQVSGGNMGYNTLDLQATPGNEVYLYIDLTNIEPSNTTNVSQVISGGLKQFFTWSYDAATKKITGKQIIPIPDYIDEYLYVNVVTTTNTNFMVSQNGFNAYITSPSVYGPTDLTNDTTSIYTFTVPIPTLLPDFNVTNVNIPISGNINTNDVVPAGTTYGSPIGKSTNPSTSLPTINPNGTYTFNTATAGVYVFTVPVCPSGQTTGCPTELLTITVLDPSLPLPPVANTDYTSTLVDSPVTLKVKVNDKAENPNGSLGLPSITVQPAHGTAIVNNDGTITYTPGVWFKDGKAHGYDTLTYQVCDTMLNPPKCTTALMIIDVVNPYITNSTTAANDYNSTIGTAAVSGNVKLNDSDPQKNIQTVTAKTVTNANGTLVLDTNGAYTFTPAPGASGTFAYPYTTCDNGTPQACATATLYILVKGSPINPLGLKLKEFKVAESNCIATISWTTTNETNTKLAEVERSYDLTNFKKIGEVTLSGNTISETLYEYKDTKLAESNEIYYRLKLVDQDNNFTFSDIKAIQVNCGNKNQGTIAIMPNPTEGQFNVKLTNFKLGEKLDIRIYTVVGQEIYSNKVVIDSKSSQIAIDLSALESAMYIVDLRGASFTENVKLIKK